jgi:hypothetical protein
MWTEVPELAHLIREGKTKWEDLNLDDVDIRMKWAGLFHRGKRTPGKFMMRLRIPNGELSGSQLRFLGSAIRPYGADGCADITTRANIQLRGVTIMDADKVIDGLLKNGLTRYEGRHACLLQGRDFMRQPCGVGSHVNLAAFSRSAACLTLLLVLLDRTAAACSTPQLYERYGQCSQPDGQPDCGRGPPRAH